MRQGDPGTDTDIYPMPDDKPEQNEIVLESLPRFTYESWIYSQDKGKASYIHPSDAERRGRS